MEKIYNSLRESVSAETYDIKNSYWFDNGEEQKKYKTLLTAIDDGKYELSKGAQGVFRRYYRFYNDGDASSRIKYLMKVRSDKDLEKDPEYRAYCAKLENDVTEAIRREYSKMQKMLPAAEKVTESVDLTEADAEHWTDLTITGSIEDDGDIYDLIERFGEIGTDFEVIDSWEVDGDYPEYILRVRAKLAARVKRAVESEFEVIDVSQYI